MASVHHRRRNVSDTHGAGEGGCLGPGGSHESPDSERGERYVYDRTCVCGSLERDCRFTLGRKPQCRKSGKTKGYEEHGIKRYSKGITGICWKPGGVSAHPRYVYYLPESQRGLSTSNTSLYISPPPSSGTLVHQYSGKRNNFLFHPPHQISPSFALQPRSSYSWLYFFSSSLIFSFSRKLYTPLYTVVGRLTCSSNSRDQGTVNCSESWNNIEFIGEGTGCGTRELRDSLSHFPLPNMARLMPQVQLNPAESPSLPLPSCSSREWVGIKRRRWSRGISLGV